MSGIVLSSSVRQNLLSLQSTADLLATTQSRLSTGKKVNTALDNPTNFFTAQSLDEVARQPGAADHRGLFHEVERFDDDLRCGCDRSARHHELHQRDCDQQCII